MLQVATRVRHFGGDPHHAITLTIVADVCSLRPQREQPKAPIPEGTLDLGREPCQDYGGWDMVTPRGRVDGQHSKGDRLVVSRLRQEHGTPTIKRDSGSRCKRAKELGSGPITHVPYAGLWMVPDH